METIYANGLSVMTTTKKEAPKTRRKRTTIIGQEERLERDKQEEETVETIRCFPGGVGGRGRNRDGKVRET